MPFRLTPISRTRRGPRLSCSSSWSLLPTSWRASTCDASSAEQDCCGRMRSSTLMQTDVAAPATTSADHEIKLDARHVDFFYGDFQALHDVSLAIQTCRITALIGP